MRCEEHHRMLQPTKTTTKQQTIQIEIKKNPLS